MLFHLGNKRNYIICEYLVKQRRWFILFPKHSDDDTCTGLSVPIMFFHSVSERCRDSDPVSQSRRWPPMSTVTTAPESRTAITTSVSDILLSQLVYGDTEFDLQTTKKKLIKKNKTIWSISHINKKNYDYVLPVHLGIGIYLTFLKFRSTTSRYPAAIGGVTSGGPTREPISRMKLK